MFVSHLLALNCLICLIGAQICILPNPSAILFLKCSINDNRIPCTSQVLANTVVQFQCENFYHLSNKNLTTVECLTSGKWSSAFPDCVPDCGKSPTAIPLVVHGSIAQARSFPWHVGLYHKNGEEWEFWCGGSLISKRMVLTAAHCSWQTPANTLKVSLRKFYRDSKKIEDNALFIEVWKVEMLRTYQDVNGNYNGDLAILFLKEPVTLSETLMPICIDWQQTFMEGQLKEGNSGISLGWGLNENDTFSEELKGIRLPVMADNECIEHQQRDFRKFITYTTFCAGYNNGSGVCNGDSGGGLAFLDKESDTWYLQGLVSVSPRRRGTPYCDPTHYTVFTKVAMFTRWLKEMVAIENSLEAEDAENKIRHTR